MKSNSSFESISTMWLLADKGLFNLDQFQVIEGYKPKMPNGEYRVIGRQDGLEHIFTDGLTKEQSEQLIRRIVDAMTAQKCIIKVNDIVKTTVENNPK